MFWDVRAVNCSFLLRGRRVLMVGVKNLAQICETACSLDGPDTYRHTVTLCVCTHILTHTYKTENTQQDVYMRTKHTHTHTLICV